MKLSIVGSGTAGLIAALQTKAILPATEITVVSSGKIPIIGVGEGSTEHFTDFSDRVNLNRPSLVANAKATYKFGIRFLGWRNHPTRDYFHSVSHGGMYRGTFNSAYAMTAAFGTALTAASSHHDFIRGYVGGDDPQHRQVNQFHFDTYALNEFLVGTCVEQGIRFVDAEVLGASRDDRGEITNLLTSAGSIETDFVIDASGFKRIVRENLGGARWKSFSEYLPCDRSIAFQTPAREDGTILPYTIAEAMDAGWRWEIPTQQRRGNGYVYSSRHMDVDRAVDEMYKATGFRPDSVREFSFDPGYLNTPWAHNCCAIGLSSSFVEPLEATSIAAAIQQSLALTSFLSTYTTSSPQAKDAARRVYNSSMESMMINILYMIRMHYISDRSDTPMWQEMLEAPMPDGMQDFLEVISLRGPEAGDLPSRGFELFKSNHFWHVAQGQGLLNRNHLKSNLTQRGDTAFVGRELRKVKESRYEKPSVPHGVALGLRHE